MSEQWLRRWCGSKMYRVIWVYAKPHAGRGWVSPSLKKVKFGFGRYFVYPVRNRAKKSHYYDLRPLNQNNRQKYER